MKSAKELIKILCTTDEVTEIEAKECTKKIDRSFMETVCAFTNEPDLGGGYLILGIHADETKFGADRYTVVGVEDTDKLQSEIANNCSTMFNHRISPQIKVEEVEGKNVIVVKVAEGEKEIKPYFFENKGLPSGAYRRIAGTDQRCTEDDMPLFYAKSDDYDKVIVDDATLDDIDENALRQYRILRAKVNPYAEELTYNDTDLLISLGCLRKNKNNEWRLTNAGLLVFGKSMALRRIAPMVRADYIRVSGMNWVEDPEKRFDTIDMRGPMILLVNRIYNAIIDDLPRQFALNEGDIQASPNIRIPEKALREAIVNALIHRSYRVHRPLQIIRYSNRIEIINPGYSLKPEESLGEPGSALRNPSISAIFHETNLAETKGSGIKAMRILMSKANLMPPTYESNHSNNTFTLRMLLHIFFTSEDMKWLKNFEQFDLTAEQKIAIAFLREVGAIDLMVYRQLTGLKNTGAKADIGKLMNAGIINSKGKGSKSYYIATELCTTLFEKDGTLEEKDGTLEEKDGTLEEKDGTIFEKLQLPLDLKERIQNLRKWERKEQLWIIVEELCSILPLSIDEIALIINRKKDYVWRIIIKPLRNEGKLAFTHPEMINHPDQKYKVGFNSYFYKE